MKNDIKLERNKVRDQIEEAFCGVVLGSGIGLWEAQAIDDYESEEVRAEKRAKDEKLDWHKISSKHLNPCYSSLSFFDAEGMRFHLPRFLLADLDGTYRQDVFFTLAQVPAYSRSQFAFLNLTQRQAIRSYLQYTLLLEDNEYDRPHIVRALDTFWTESGYPPK